jgi:hypothetical protein
MEFPFYPKHESGCGHPNHCPHAGGASIGTLIHFAQKKTPSTSARCSERSMRKGSTVANFLTNLKTSDTSLPKCSTGCPAMQIGTQGETG